MNKMDHKRPLIVGIFIFIGLAIFAVGVFTIGSQQKLFEKKFVLKLIFDDVGGLQQGNNVWLSGVKVGTVKKIVFHGNTQVEITINIEKAAQPHIFRDARGKISTDGFIGNKIVVIYGGTPQAGTVRDGDFLKSEIGISTEDMLATLQSSNINLLEITGNFRKISEKLAGGEGILGRLINDPSTVKSLRSTIRNLNGASLKADETVKNILNFSSRLNNQNGLVNELISDTLIFDNLKEIVTQLKETSINASVIVDSLQYQLNEKKDNTLGMFLRDEKTARDLKEIIINLKASSQKLNEDLEAVQHNFLLRSYFQKKEKKNPN